MADFFTRIRMDKNSIVVHEKQKVSGKFAVDIEELNIARDFRFVKENPLDCSRCRVVLYKDEELFLSHQGVLSDKSFLRYHPDKGLILRAFYVIYKAHKNQLPFEQYACTKVQRTSTSVLVTTTTPDQFRLGFMRACL